MSHGSFYKKWFIFAVTIQAKPKIIHHSLMLVSYTHHTVKKILVNCKMLLNPCVWLAFWHLKNSNIYCYLNLINLMNLEVNLIKNPLAVLMSSMVIWASCNIKVIKRKWSLLYLITVLIKIVCIFWRYKL